MTALFWIMAAASCCLLAHSGIQVVREPDVRGPDESRGVLGQEYASLTGRTMLRAVRTKKGIVIRRSEDNGNTWHRDEVVAAPKALDGARVLSPQFDAFYLDPDNGLVVRFLGELIDTTKPGAILYANAVGMGPHTRRMFYQISRDQGRTWGPRQQVIEKGPEYDSEHWARDVWYGRSGLVLEGRRLLKLPDGTIVAPCYLWPTKEQMNQIFRQEGRPRELWGDANYYIHTLCLLGRWRKDLSGLEWQSGGAILLPGGYTSAGTCGSDEPAIAVLDDGRLFAVVRTSTGAEPAFRKKGIPVLRYCAVSSDGGRSWKDVRPLTYSDGSVLYSPSAYSEFIKSSKNGKWYWIANIVKEPTYGACDPRHPLQIAELDTDRLGIKRETVTVIEDRKPTDPGLVRFSNFRVYEERGSQDFILLMTVSYSEVQKDYQHLPRPSFRYRIHLPD